jgi:N-acetylmuramoyl-L-alanine amidase
VLYDHPENAELRRLRPNPNVLMPGDTLHIPDPTPAGLPVETGRWNTFVVRLPGSLFRLHLVDDDPERTPFAHARFKLEVGGQTHEGETDGAGRLEVRVPLDAEDGTLTLWLSDDAEDSVQWPVKVNHLDPADALTGAQARLHHLGFDCGALDGEHGDKTENALRAFQATHGIDEEEALGPRTRTQLERLHGS